MPNESLNEQDLPLVTEKFQPNLKPFYLSNNLEFGRMETMFRFKGLKLRGRE